MVVAAAVALGLGLVASCGSSGGSLGAGPTGARRTSSGAPGTGGRRHPGLRSPDTGAGPTTDRTVVDRGRPPSSCPPPTTAPHRTTTTAASPGRWPPLGYDRSALVRADLLSWREGVAEVRWQPGQGVDATCRIGLRADRMWVLDASGYREIQGSAIADFLARRTAELGSTADGVPVLVEVSADGTAARQLAEIPPG